MCSSNSHICAPPSCPVTASEHNSSKRPCRIGHSLLAKSKNLLSLLIDISKCCAQSRDAPLQMMSHSVRRLTKTTSDFLCGQPFVIGHFYDCPLMRFEVLQDLFCQPNRFRHLSPRRAARAVLDRGFQVLPAVEVIRDKMPLPV